jgi:RNA polymerase sigma factor (sigma-70 family)
VRGLKEIEYDDKGFMKHMDDRKASYRATYRMVKESIKKNDAELSDDYYQKTGKRIRQEHKDTKIKEGMITDLNVAINQMHTGREAGSKKGVHRKRAYDIDKIIDPLYIQMYHSPTNSRSSSTLSDYQKWQISDALSRLSEKERECYVMSAGDCLSFADIANHLGISKGTVQTHVERARKKVGKELQQSLFLQEFKWEREDEGWQQGD